jgi:hypothetical protein
VHRCQYKTLGILNFTRLSSLHSLPFHSPFTLENNFFILKGNIDFHLKKGKRSEVRGLTQWQSMYVVLDTIPNTEKKTEQEEKKKTKRERYGDKLA